MATNYPPVSLNEEEANSLIISELLIKNQGDISLFKNFNSLVIKIKLTLKNFQKENVELLSTFIKAMIFKHFEIFNMHQ